MDPGQTAGRGAVRSGLTMLAEEACKTSKKTTFLRLALYGLTCSYHDVKVRFEEKYI